MGLEIIDKIGHFLTHATTLKNIQMNQSKSIGQPFLEETKRTSSSNHYKSWSIDDPTIELDREEANQAPESHSIVG